MPRFFILLFCLALVACKDPSRGMHQQPPELEARPKLSHLPKGWKAEDFIPYDHLRDEPPAASEPGQIQLYGMRQGEEAHRLYSVPAETSVAEIVHFFEVGSHGALSYSYDEEATIKRVAHKAGMMTQRFPSQITFADPAGMIIKFLRPVTKEDLACLDQLFPENEGFQTGAEAYIIEQNDGSRHRFQRVQDENKFHFWWD